MTRSHICPMRCQETSSRSEEVSRYWLRPFVFLQWEQKDGLCEGFNLSYFLRWLVFKSTFTGELTVYYNYYSIYFQIWTSIINSNNTDFAFILYNLFFLNHLSWESTSYCFKYWGKCTCVFLVFVFSISFNHSSFFFTI